MSRTSVRRRLLVALVSVIATMSIGSATTIVGASPASAALACCFQ